MVGVFVNNRERMKEIILQLKQIKYDRELSVLDIHGMVKDAGYFTSPSSVRRVFEPGSENKNFRYRDTIQPIAQVLIGVNEEAEPLTAPEADALKNIALLKDNIIKELESKNAELEINYNNELAKTAFLFDQLKIKDDQIKNLHRLITKILGDE